MNSFFSNIHFDLPYKFITYHIICGMYIVVVVIVISKIIKTSYED